MCLNPIRAIYFASNQKKNFKVVEIKNFWARVHQTNLFFHCWPDLAMIWLPAKLQAYRSVYMFCRGTWEEEKSPGLAVEFEPPLWGPQGPEDTKWNLLKTIHFRYIFRITDLLALLISCPIEVKRWRPDVRN